MSACCWQKGQPWRGVRSNANRPDDALLPLTKSSSVSPCSSLEALVLASPVLCRPMTTHMPPSIASKAASAVFLTCS